MVMIMAENEIAALLIIVILIVGVISLALSDN